MNEINLLIGSQFVGLNNREFDWLLLLSNDTSIAISCLWRLLEGGRICLTNNDEGQKFGRSSLVDCGAEIKARLTDTTVDNVALTEGTLDLELRFSSGHRLQILPDSGGYESWQITIGTRNILAVGGGDLTVY